MRYAVNTFKGEIPRASARLLPPSHGQIATNCRFGSGDLEPFRQFTLAKTLAAAAQTIYKLNGEWLSWNAQVDVARGVIPGDTNYFAFLTAPSIYSTPQYTTFDLATTGAEPYPVDTNPLGMPAPTTAPDAVPGVDSTPTDFGVDVTDDGDSLASDWSTGPSFNEYNHTAMVTQEAGTGNAAPSYQVSIENNNSEGAYAFRNFGIAAAAAAEMSADVSISAAQADDGIVIQLGVGLDTTGAGVRVGVYSDIGSPVLAIQLGTGWSTDSIVSSVAVGSGLTRAVWYTLTATVTVNDDGTLQVTATLDNGGTPLQTLSATVSASLGDYCAIMGRTGDDQKNTFYDNIHVAASGATDYIPITTATSYVYTFVNNDVAGTGVDWESAPSPTSSTINRPDGVSVTVKTATSHGFDAGYGINAKRIYRAVSGATGDVFMFVAEIALATADYVDELDDSEISNPGVVLETEDWDLPNEDMEGIIVLPNGTMAGFFENQLCFCVVGRPHAWPIKWRLTTDSKIVAISNIDNTIVIGTETFVYTATGTLPENYTMSKPGAAQACVSKPSMTYLDNFGVVFASPDGMQVCSGSAANVLNATRVIFDKPQWEALTPSSVRSAVYDGVLFIWVTGTTPDSGYAIDTNREGWGLTRLSFHPQAVHVDPLLDAMFMVLDVNSEPTDVLLPEASTAVTPAATSIFQFDAHATAKMVYTWRGPLNLTPYPATMHFAKLEAADFDNVVSKVYADGTLLQAKVNDNGRPYRLPAEQPADSYEQEILGTSRVRTYQIASNVDEFARG